MRTGQLLTWIFLAAPFAAASAPSFTLPQVLDYPYSSELTAASHADIIAWVRNIGGVRNIWIARGSDFAPRQVTSYREDDGQEITQLTFSPDGTRLVYVLGGDHDANWPAEGNLDPDPASSPEQPHAAIWSAPLTGGAPVKIAEGDAPAISARGQLAYTHEDHVFTAAWDGSKPEPLFFDRGKDSDSGLVAGRKPSRLRLQARRSLVHRNIQRQGRTDPVSRAVHLPGRVSALGTGRRAHRLRKTAGRRRAAGARPHTGTAPLVDLGRLGRRRHCACRVAKPGHARGVVPRRRRRARICIGPPGSVWCFSRISTTGPIFIPCRRRADRRRC